MQLNEGTQLSEEVIKATGHILRTVETGIYKPLKFSELQTCYENPTAPKGNEFQKFLGTIARFHFCKYIEATLHFSLKDYEEGYADSFLIQNAESKQQSPSMDISMLQVRSSIFKPAQPFGIKELEHLTSILFQPPLAKHEYSFGFSVSLKPGNKFDSLKNDFKMYLEGFMNEAFVSIHNEFYSYLFQREYCLQTLYGLSHHFGAVHLLSKTDFSPPEKFLFHHLIHALEIENLIEIVESYQSSYLVKPLKNPSFGAVTIPNDHHRAKEVEEGFTFTEGILRYRSKVLDIPGKYSFKLLNTFFSKERPVGEYWTETEIYEHWGYDTDKMLDIAHKKRVYHAARKISSVVRMQTGKVDFIEEDKREERYRLNPRYFS